MSDRNESAPARWPWWQFLCFVCLVLPIALIVGAMAGGFVKSAVVSSVAGRQVLFTHGFIFSSVSVSDSPSQADYTFAGHTASVDATDVTIDKETKIAIPAATKKIELSWFKDQIVVVADQTVLWNKKL